MNLLRQLEVESLDSIVERLSLVRVDHPDGRTILNYSQINSPKYEPIVRECRGLVLDRNTNTVVARAFDRFFNYGECLECDRVFDWNSATVREKVDGSLIVAYYWQGEWRFNTRGSFGDGQCGKSGKSWSELVKDLLPEDLGDMVLGCTYVFEFCSTWNQVVAYHPIPRLFLLDVVYSQNGRSCLDSSADAVADDLGVDRPQVFSLNNARDCVAILSGDQFGPTFEGFVAQDRHGNRVKIKNVRYVALHHLVDNGNIYMERRLVPLILAGETKEVLTYFPDLRDRVLEVEGKITAAINNAVATWESADNTDQKSFALSVKNDRLSGVLFSARKTGRHPREVVREMSDYVTKALFGG